MFDALVSGMGQVNRPLGLEEGGASFLYKYFPSVCESDYPPLLTLEKIKAMLEHARMKKVVGSANF